MGGVTRAAFDAQRGTSGALVIGDPETVAEKILHYDEVLGGIARFQMQMDPGSLSHAKLMRATDLLGGQVVPAMRRARAVA